MILLHVGAGAGQVPEEYDGWDVHSLDINPDCKPDIVADARTMRLMNTYDAVFCSHTLEHFHTHEVPDVLKNFKNALKDGGQVSIVVPNLKALLTDLAVSSRELTDTWYRTGNGLAIRYIDVLFGWEAVMRDGNLFYAHKTGFSPWTLGEALTHAGFIDIRLQDLGLDIHARATKCQ